MVVRTAWAACTATLLSLSVSRANGPVGGFFVARHPRSRRLLDGQVQQRQQQARRAIVAAQLLGSSREEGRLGEGLACGLGRVASAAAAALGPGGRRGGNKLRKSTETAETCGSSNNNNDHATTAVLAEGAAEQTPAGQAARPELHGQSRGPPSPVEALALTSRQLGLRASTTIAALGSREGKRRRSASSLLMRGGGGGGRGAPETSPSSPPPQADRWKNAVEGLKNGLASGLAAACVKTVLQPFDTMKTVQQFSTTR